VPPPSLFNRWLHRWACLTAAATLALLGAGGLVTSHGAGLAVPDWPNTYGYNMFFFPVSRWVGGIFYEHTHRLLATAVGLMTVLLALWLHGRRARGFLRWAGLLLTGAGMGVGFYAPGHWADALVMAAAGLGSSLLSRIWPRSEPEPRWLRWLGVVAVLAVVGQGVLGGLRVILLKDQIGIIHATLAQLFFVLVCAIAFFTSRWWRQSRSVSFAPEAGLLSRDFASLKSMGTMFLTATLLVLGQLVLGAAMRHQHAGLAIPDFPLAYGRLWPGTDPESVAHYNLHRIEVFAANPITALQIQLQMLHRLNAVCILVAVAGCAWSARRRYGARNPISALAAIWLGLILTQVLLGAATIWSGKAADVATAHVVVGALSMAVGSLATVVLWHDLLCLQKYAAVFSPKITHEPPAFNPAPVPETR
jgi:heme a synthase